MENKEQGLTAIQDIMKQYQISLEDIKSYISGDSSQQSSSVIVQLFAYLGGVLVLCGVATFVAMHWEEMNSVTRVLTTLGSGFVAFVMGVLLLNDSRYAKLVTPLFIVAALLELGGMFVFLDEYFTPTGNWQHGSMLVHSVVGIQFGLAFITLRRDVLLFVTILCISMFFGSWLDYLRVDGEVIALIIGFALLITSFLLQRTRHTLITPIWYFVASFMFLYGLFDAVKKSYGEILFILVNVGIIYLSIYVRSRTLLFVGIVSFFSYLSYTAYEYFLNSTGWPLLLIALGLILFGLSALGVKINRKYLS